MELENLQYLDMSMSTKTNYRNIYASNLAILNMICDHKIKLSDLDLFDFVNDFLLTSILAEIEIYKNEENKALARANLGIDCNDFVLIGLFSLLKEKIGKKITSDTYLKQFNILQFFITNFLGVISSVLNIFFEIVDESEIELLKIQEDYLTQKQNINISINKIYDDKYDPIELIEKLSYKFINSNWIYDSVSNIYTYNNNNDNTNIDDFLIE